MKIGIVGAGHMGTGIAQHISSVEGFEVYLCDINELVAGRAKKTIRARLDKRVAQGKITKEQMDAQMDRISTGTKYICEDADLVIEVTYEDLNIKKQTLRSSTRSASRNAFSARTPRASPSRSSGRGSAAR